MRQNKYMLEAPTMLELKARLRRSLGWNDRTAWGANERHTVTDLFDVDETSAGFCAKPKDFTYDAKSGRTSHCSWRWGRDGVLKAQVTA